MEDGCMFNLALAREDSALSRLPRQDRALTERIVRTALKHHGEIRMALSRYISRPLPRRAGWVRAVLHTAAAQILFMRTPDHAVIDLAVSLARTKPATRHLAGLVNAVLRRIAATREALLAEQDPFRLNLPDWLHAAWTRTWGTQTTRAIMQAVMEDPPLDLTVKAPESIETWARRLNAAILPNGTLRIDHPKSPVTALPGFAEGAWWVQDVAAALPVRLLGDVRDRAILDLCAAPGGKTAQLAAAGAKVTALDISEKRLERLHENLKRLDLSAEIVCADVLNWTPPRRYDAILLDAPCTATGTARRHPEVFWLKTDQQQAALVDLQYRMLHAAIDMLKPGGILVYCVCSLQPEEGEKQIARISTELRDKVSLLPVKAEALRGLSNAATPDGALRTLPHYRIGASRTMDGFFAASLIKKAA